MGSPPLSARRVNAKDEIEQISAGNPLAVERVLALCAGEIGRGEDWHNVRSLDSFVIDGSEIIYRLTFCQDTDEQASGLESHDSSAVGTCGTF